MTHEEPVEALKATTEVTAESTHRILVLDVCCIDAGLTVELEKAAGEIGLDGIAAVHLASGGPIRARATDSYSTAGRQS